jgi:hypothetical protein
MIHEMQNFGEQEKSLFQGIYQCVCDVNERVNKTNLPDFRLIEKSFALTMEPTVQ